MGSIQNASLCPFSLSYQHRLHPLPRMDHSSDGCVWVGSSWMWTGLLCFLQTQTSRHWSTKCLGTREHLLTIQRADVPIQVQIGLCGNLVLKEMLVGDRDGRCSRRSESTRSQLYPSPIKVVRLGRSIAWGEVKLELLITSVLSPYSRNRREALPKAMLRSETRSTEQPDVIRTFHEDGVTVRKYRLSKLDRLKRRKTYGERGKQRRPVSTNWEHFVKQ